MSITPSLVRLGPPAVGAPKRRTRSPDPEQLSVPISQLTAKAWFDSSSDTTSRRGRYGEVRLADAVYARGEDRFKVAVKRIDVEEPMRAAVALNEYEAHRAIYACLPPVAKERLAEPFEMQMPCSLIDLRKLSPIGAPSTPTPSTLLLDASDESARALTDRSGHHQVVCESFELFLVQAWACPLGEQTVSLGDLRHAGRAPSDATLARIGADVGMALRAVHRCGYRHNDLASRNVVVCGAEPTVHAVLIDFGLAQGPTWDDTESLNEAVYGDAALLANEWLGRPELMRALVEAYRAT